jgi:hypothetical protein
MDQEPLQVEITSYEKSERRSLYSALGLGVAIATIISAVFSLAPRLLSNITVPLLIGGIILVGVGLFIVRERARLAYGIVEFLIGLVVIFALFIPSHFSITAVDFTLDLGLKIAGGLYICNRQPQLQHFWQSGIHNFWQQ